MVGQWWELLLEKLGQIEARASRCRMLLEGDGDSESATLFATLRKLCSDRKDDGVSIVVRAQRARVGQRID